LDEVDRADEAFEAFLLELLSDFQISIPELGTIEAKHPPLVVLTSNRSRELSDALKRRCLYHWIDYPTAEKERTIVAARLPGIAGQLDRQVVSFVQSVRRLNLVKSPGVAETLDWAQALMALGKTTLDLSAAEETLGCLAKSMDDIAKIKSAGIENIIAEAGCYGAVLAVRSGRSGGRFLPLCSQPWTVRRHYRDPECIAGNRGCWNRWWN
jgi:MoxR-like ATPase